MSNRIQLSKRLNAVASLVPQCDCVADVGTDHGYIPIFLKQQNRCDHAIAMDVRKGPLERAREHIEVYNLQGYIDTRLSDGLAALNPGEADVIVIAGMGGATMQQILARGEDVLKKNTVLILQPQSELFEFRSWIFSHGYELLKEDMVFEDGKYYPLMQVRYGGNCRAAYDQSYSETELSFGPMLLREQHPVLRAYLNWILSQKEQILKRIMSNASEDVKSRRVEELEKEMGEIADVLSSFYRGEEL